MQSSPVLVGDTAVDTVFHRSFGFPHGQYLTASDKWFPDALGETRGAGGRPRTTLCLAKGKVSCANGAFNVDTAEVDEARCGMLSWTQH